jgi:4-amino-4-deoxy-L-arabinose transferase-like glycosyltransferase
MFFTVLFFTIRYLSLGHAITWDEAWILNALKSFAGGGTLFSNQLWRHPPIYIGLGLLLGPLEQGLDVRMQLLSLAINTAALFVFLIYVTQLFGRRIAVLAGIAYIFLPGPLLFDTWIKRDCLVTLFCMLSLLAFFKKKEILAGLFLGLGFLSKETAVFFMAGYVLVLLLFYRPQKTVRMAASIFLPALIVSIWWYIFFAQGTEAYISFFRGKSIEASDFVKPWWYYFAKLRYDLGWPGLIFFIAGLLALIPPMKSLKAKKSLICHFRRKRLLPFYMILPAYVLLTVSKGKPPWMILSLYPFLALIVAIGWAFLFKGLNKLLYKHYSKLNKLQPIGSPLLLALLLGIFTLPFSHITYLEKMSPSTVGVMRSSYEMAQAVNYNVQDNEKLMIMPMLYRSGPTMPDPIFYWHVKPLMIYRHLLLDTGYSDFKKIIIKNKINWVLMSPVTNSNQEKFMKKTIQDIKTSGYSMSRAALINVDGFWKNPLSE